MGFLSLSLLFKNTPRAFTSDREHKNRMCWICLTAEPNRNQKIQRISCTTNHQKRNTQVSHKTSCIIINSIFLPLLTEILKMVNSMVPFIGFTLSLYLSLFCFSFASLFIEWGLRHQMLQIRRSSLKNVNAKPSTWNEKKIELRLTIGLHFCHHRLFAPFEGEAKRRM